MEVLHFSPTSKPASEFLPTEETTIGLCTAALRAPKIAIANRRDVLSQTSPSPAERTAVGTLYLENTQKKSQSSANLRRKDKSQGLSGGEGYWGPKNRCDFFKCVRKSQSQSQHQCSLTLRPGLKSIEPQHHSVLILQLCSVSRERENEGRRSQRPCQNRASMG